MRQVSVSWARPGSGFTMLFEALALTFATAMPVSKVAEMTREHDTRIWRVLEHHVHAARDRQDFSTVGKVGMDETSARKGQDYVSIFADMELGRVLFATEGRSADTVARFAADLAEHGGDPKKITDTNSDMSAAFISGIGEHLPNTGGDRRQVPCGRQARRSGQRGSPRRGQDPPGAQVHPVAVAEEPLEPLDEATGRAAPADASLGQARHRPGTAMARGLSTPSTTSTPATRPSTCDAGATARNAPASNPSKTSWRSWKSTGTPVIAWHASRLNNGLLEGINSLVQVAKARARGYRNKNKMITIIYLTAAKLPLPTVTNPVPAYMASR
ncbi:MAG: transposase [Thermoleophilaceae bacterium]